MFTQAFAWRSIMRSKYLCRPYYWALPPKIANYYYDCIFQSIALFFLAFICVSYGMWFLANRFRILYSREIKYFFVFVILFWCLHAFILRITVWLYMYTYVFFVFGCDIIKICNILMINADCGFYCAVIHCHIDNKK